MFAQSRELPGSRAVLDAVTDKRRYFIGPSTTNPLSSTNTALKLSSFARIFWFSSAPAMFTPANLKPTIFRVALEVTQRRAEKCIFIDDRPLNLESPRKLGFQTIHFRNPEQLKTDLAKLGVEV